MAPATDPPEPGDPGVDEVGDDELGDIQAGACSLDTVERMVRDEESG